jgi:hypothetical protein
MGLYLPTMLEKYLRIIVVISRSVDLVVENPPSRA